MIDRLNEINTDLIARRELAETKGWLGELEGTSTSRSGSSKTRRRRTLLARRGPTSLGLPTIGI
jgi:hypothetical protein